ncbi:hypothetical protein Trydic_g11152 [Trypoxylus dichotomus]
MQDLLRDQQVGGHLPAMKHYYVRTCGVSQDIPSQNSSWGEENHRKSQPCETTPGSEAGTSRLIAEHDTEPAAFKIVTVTD